MLSNRVFSCKHYSHYSGLNKSYQIHSHHTHTSLTVLPMQCSQRALMLQKLHTSRKPLFVLCQFPHAITLRLHVRHAEYMQFLVYIHSIYKPQTFLCAIIKSQLTLHGSSPSPQPCSPVHYQYTLHQLHKNAMGKVCVKIINSELDSMHDLKIKSEIKSKYNQHQHQ